MQSKDIIATKVAEEDIYAVTVPAGDWTQFNIVRCNPSTFDSNNIWASRWNQTGDIPINQDMVADPYQDGANLSSNVNLVDWFTAAVDRSYHAHWGYFPAKPS